MNYILQLNGFWNWVRTNEISHLEVDLYLSILDIANTSSWKTQFTIPNSTLGRFDKNSLTRARNRLVQYGLITYEKGKKGQAPYYGIIRLYDNDISCNINPNNDTNNDTNNIINPNNDTYIDTNSDTNSDTNLIPIQGTYINKKENKTKQKIKTPIIPFDGKLGEKVSEWLKYKAERNQKYKSTGMNNLFKVIQSNVDLYGDDAVIGVIDVSIINNWQGLFFDRLEKGGNVSGSTKATDTGGTGDTAFFGYDYDNIVR